MPGVQRARRLGRCATLVLSGMLWCGWIAGCAGNPEAGQAAPQAGANHLSDVQAIHLPLPFRVAGSPLTALHPKDVASDPRLKAVAKEVHGWDSEAALYLIDWPVYRIASPTMQRITPKWRFYVFFFHMKKNPNYKGLVSLIVGQVPETIGVNDRGEVRDFSPDDGTSEFWKFLHDQGVHLRHAKEARLVWRAYCDVVRNDWPGRKLKQVGSHAWRMGWREGKDQDSYYLVKTDAAGMVQSGDLQVIERQKNKPMATQ